MPKPITNAVLAEKIDNLIRLLTSHILADETSFHTITEFIDGNGKPGLKTRIDRVEQLEIDRRWQWKTVWGGLIATALGLIAKVVFG